MARALVRRWLAGPGLVLVGWIAPAATGLRAEEAPIPAERASVSFDKQIRPIFQARCQGCHQPAKRGGGYVMTDFARLLGGGESREPAIVPGQPAAGSLLDRITPDATGRAAMPPDRPALSGAEVDLIRRWIAGGAGDDSPAPDRAPIDAGHPPTYARPPVIAALDFSPDGTLLAVGGFHEVLLWQADGSALVARLIGLAERIESVAFSPDGRQLAVTGGHPSRMGEVQVWDVATHKLMLSVAATSDTLNGASWSPDGSKLAFGANDNSVRAIDVKTGQQLLFMGSHTDWALDTAFVGPDHLVSVGRDMTTKLTEVATQRFVDNVTSITPGALKGGLAAVAKIPPRDEILVGGADGIPKLYRVFRETERKIGDDANLIAALAPMTGRIFAVAASADGRRLAAASSLDRRGQVDLYADDFVLAASPDAIRAIVAKPGPARSAAERATLDKHRQAQIHRVAAVPTPRGSLYALAVRPDGASVAVAGSEGIVRLLDPATGALVAEFCPVAVDATAPEPRPRPAEVVRAATGDATSAPPEPDITGAISRLEVQPPAIDLTNPTDRVQLVVTAIRAGGDGPIDATRAVAAAGAAGVVEVTPAGLVAPIGDGAASLRLTLGDVSAEVPVRVGGMSHPPRADFVRDVAPVLSKLGCNAGTCHGSAQGKNGFKLSLRGYDPIFDTRALTDDHGSRRVNLASPDDSLMLLKAGGGVPHVGGALIRPDSAAYATLRTWIAAGARLDPGGTAKVASIAVHPVNPVVGPIGARQQLRVVATYGDGTTRDVTREAFTESGNAEVALADRTGLMTTLRRGEAPILVRYEGAYAATTLSVMGDRTGFVATDPPMQNRIDELTAAKWRRMKIEPSAPCTDAEFLRRATLDLTGLPPTSAEVRAFGADPAPSSAKRTALIDRLMARPEFVDHWTNKWADLLQVNRKFLGTTGAAAFRGWIREQVAANVPYDQFVRSLLTASGSNRTNPAASYYKILREPTAIMENTTQLFLAVRFNCNKCHDHPFERWTQDQYYELSAFFAQVGLKDDPASNGRSIGGSAVEAAQSLFEEVYDKTDGAVVHDRTKQVAAAQFPFTCASTSGADAGNRRAALAAWITAKDNPYFARSYVNRLWGYLFGVGIIEPIDDIRAGNPASNPELLAYLTEEFVASGFDARHVIRLICQSRTYGLSVAPTRWNGDDRINFAHATARRLPAEVLLDSVYRATGSTSQFPGVPAGTRAAALPDSGVEVPSGFLATLGRPVRESACECERSAGLQLGPVMALVSGPTLGDAIADPANDVTKLAQTEPDDARLVEELFLRILNRPASSSEIATCLADLGAIDRDGAELAAAATARAFEVAQDLIPLESARLTAIAAARTALEAHEAAHSARYAAAEQVRLDQIAGAEADLHAYEAREPERIAAWEQAQPPLNRWLPLVPTTVGDVNRATFTIQADGAVLAAGATGTGQTTIVAATDLKRVTGLRLEVLTDPSLPSQGPGRAPNGNFVLNKIQVTAAPRDRPTETHPLRLIHARADFTQAGFDIVDASNDAPPDPNEGWAIYGALGRSHWATFDLEAPAEWAAGTILTVDLIHRYPDGRHIPGKFRLSVAASPGPAGLSLSTELQTALTTAPEIRSEAQRAAILAHHRTIDAGLSGRQATLAAARRPLPIDPERQHLRDRLAEAQRPIPADPLLAQLSRDAATASRQAQARRLTAAQDIAWALINSPGFLFNH